MTNVDRTRPAIHLFVTLLSHTVVDALFILIWILNSSFSRIQEQ